MNNEERKKIIEKLENIDSQITLLNDLKKKLVSKLDNLPEEKSPSTSLITPCDFNKKQNLYDVLTIDKIDLFRSFFRGRDDVYARYWISRKSGKTGYSPVCKNEWVKQICQKPIVKCSECPNRELVTLDNEVIGKHLRGIEVVGIYPMLQDETCCFLAVDFDGEDWIDNIFAFNKTCRQEAVPVAIERSRSGKGGHAWIFFEENIPAILARRMGSFLITKTMSQRYQLDMKSYDRLFPNQDTLPKGGFGNLIALPFQKEAVKRSNSVFIDESGKPYTDQWEYLSMLKRMSLGDVEKFSKEVTGSGQIIGVRMSPVDESDPPWMRLPSGKRRYKPAIKGLPDKIELVIANRIYIKTDGIPSVLLNQSKRLAAFQNPEFYKRQSMRLSTFLTPRVISCSEILDGYLAIPRGCLKDLVCLLNEYGVEVNLRDERVIGKRIKFKFCGSLTKDQKATSRKVIKDDIGILVAPPGIGKTVIAIYTIAKRKINTLILVHRKPLLEQWRLQLASFLGLELKDIGQIGAGEDKANGSLDIAMIQSMERKGMVDDRIIDYGNIIVDECHHVSAVSFERVLMQAKAKYILGLTATPYRRDGHQPIIHMQCGPICYQKKQKEIIQSISEYFIIPRMTEFAYSWKDDSNIYDLWPKLINNEARNRLILADILRVVREGRFPVILTERKEHLEILRQMLEGKIEHLSILYGGLSVKRRREIMEKLRSCTADSKVILATGAYIGEGFDDSRLDTLFLAMPISFKGKVVQYVGRLHRQHKDKNDVYIYDYVDSSVPMLLRMYEKRLTTYKRLGYKVQTDEVKILR